MQGTVRDMDMLGRVKTGKGLAYALLTPAFYGAGLACLLTPVESLANVFLWARGPDAVTLWRMLGASLLMLPSWTVSLKVRVRQLIQLAARLRLMLAAVRSWKSTRDQLQSFVA